MPGRRAGSPIAVQYMRQYNAESQKQGRKGFNSQVRRLELTILLLFRLSYGQTQHTVLIENAEFASVIQTSYIKMLCTMLDKIYENVDYNKYNNS